MAVIRDGVQVHGLKRVIGLVQTANAGSAHVLQKLGLRFERKIILDDDLAQTDLYAIAVDLPPPRRS